MVPEEQEQRCVECGEAAQAMEWDVVTSTGTVYLQAWTCEEHAPIVEQPVAKCDRCEDLFGPWLMAPVDADDPSSPQLCPRCIREVLDGA